MRERAALAWYEALTLLPQTSAPDDVFGDVEAQFSAAEIVALTFQIVAINGWNRLAVGMRTPVGDYVSLVGRDAGATGVSPRYRRGSRHGWDGA